MDATQTQHISASEQATQQLPQTQAQIATQEQIHFDDEENEDNVAPAMDYQIPKPPGKEAVFEMDNSDDDDDYQDNQSSEDEKPKPASSIKPVSTRKKSKPASDEDEPAPVKTDAEDTYKPKAKQVDEIDKMLGIKKGSRDKSVKGFDAEADNIAEKLVTKMTIAAEEDRRAVQKKSPAISKLALLSEVQEQASKIVLLPALIEAGFIEKLAYWLQPLHKGSLPDLNIRSAVLQILLAIPVKGDSSKLIRFEEFDGLEVEHLKCGIGKWVRLKIIYTLQVRLLANSDKETPENKRRANVIVEKWNRLIHGLSDTYKAGAKPNVSPAKPKKRKMEDSDEQLQPPSKRARIPRIEGHDFTLIPTKSPKLLKAKQMDEGKKKATDSSNKKN